MVLLRRVLGDTLRGRRLDQHRTLREVSTEAKVSLGYLSELERGQKEASSELLASICDALGVQMSDVLRDVSDTLALAEEMDTMLTPMPAGAGDAQFADQPAELAGRPEPGEFAAQPGAADAATGPQVGTVTDSIALGRTGATLTSQFRGTAARRRREVVWAA